METELDENHRVFKVQSKHVFIKIVEKYINTGLPA